MKPSYYWSGWRAVNATGYMLIHCLWVVGKSKGKGYGSLLLNECIEDASNRCDLLNTHGLMNLPIEIKGQWHDEIWTAAAEQLQSYTREYHSNGRGIYLVLWFGYLGHNHPKNPHGWTGQPLPKTLNEMKDLLAMKFANVSEKTKILTIDLSKSF